MRDSLQKPSAAEMEGVCRRLEEAGATLLALPQRGMGPQLRMARWPESPSKGGEAARVGRPLRPAVPGALEISRMDEAFAWVALIPADKVVVKRIVHARSLVSPLTGRHLYSWRKLGTLLGADHKAVQRWHGDGLTIIWQRLRSMGKNA